MRNYNGAADNRSKYQYSEERQHLDPIAEYDNEFEVEYTAATETNYDDNETLDEDEYQYYEHDRKYNTRKRYIKQADSRETHTTPNHVQFIYKNNEAENAMERPLRKQSTKVSLGNTVSPTTSKSKIDPIRFNKLINSNNGAYQRSDKLKKSEVLVDALHTIHEKIKSNSPNLSRNQSTNTSGPEATVQPMQHISTKTKRRNTIVNEQIHHDSGDGPCLSSLSEFLKLTDESAIDASAADNETVANCLVNDISSLQMDNMRKINKMDRYKQEMDQNFSKSFNFETFRQQLDRKYETDQQNQSSSAYQGLPNSILGKFPQNILESLNYPDKTYSSNQINLGIEGITSSGQIFKQECTPKYDDETYGQEEEENAYWNVDNVSQLVSSSKEDLSELRNLEKTKNMICELINKEIQKIAKTKNLDISVLLQGRESFTCSEDFRKTRLETLKSLQTGIKKLINLESYDE